MPGPLDQSDSLAMLRDYLQGPHWKTGTHRRLTAVAARYRRDAAYDLVHDALAAVFEGKRVWDPEFQPGAEAFFAAGVQQLASPPPRHAPHVDPGARHRAERLYATLLERLDADPVAVRVARITRDDVHEAHEQARILRIPVKEVYAARGRLEPILQTLIANDRGGTASQAARGGDEPAPDSGVPQDNLPKLGAADAIASLRAQAGADRELHEELGRSPEETAHVLVARGLDLTEQEARADRILALTRVPPPAVMLPPPATRWFVLGGVVALVAAIAATVFLLAR